MTYLMDGPSIKRGEFGLDKNDQKTELCFFLLFYLKKNSKYSM